ncbi:hypothetical protein [Streptomyces sp. NPDC055210]
MCNRYTDQQVEQMSDRLARIERHRERVLIGTVVFAWVASVACTAGILYSAHHGSGPYTTTFIFFTGGFYGLGRKIHKKWKRARARRRNRART